MPTGFKKIIKTGKTPLVVGGSGFYIDTFLFGKEFPAIKPNTKLRKKLSQKSATELFAMLQALDPERAETIDKHNRIRLIRAIEIATALGSVPVVTEKNSYDVLWIGLDIPTETLKNKIELRLKKRFKQGMMAEIKRLHGAGVSWKKLERFGLEYRYIAEFLQGKLTKKEMEHLLEIAINQYAKRQRTWFKRNKKIKWFNPADTETILQTVKEWL